MKDGGKVGMKDLVQDFLQAASSVFSMAMIEQTRTEGDGS